MPLTRGNAGLTEGTQRVYSDRTRYLTVESVALGANEAQTRGSPMASVQDVWHTTRDGVKVRSATYGHGARWVVRWRNHDGSQGKARFRTKDAAESHAAKVTLSPAEKRSQMTVSDLFPRYLAGKRGLKASSIHDIEQQWRLHLRDQLGHVAIVDLTPQDVRVWLAGVSSPSVGRRSMAVLSGVLALAVEEELIRYSPATGVKRPAPMKRTAQPVGVSDVKRLAEACRPHQNFVYVLAYCGLRFGEAAALRVGDLDPERRRITVSRSITSVGGSLVEGTPKSGKSRQVPVPAWLAERLQEASEGRSGDEYLLPTSFGGPWRASSWKRVWGPARESVGLPTVTAHGLRHTFASLAIEAGADVKVLQELLGHSTAALTLDTYGHLMSDRIDAIGDLMEGLTKPEAAPKTRPKTAEAVVESATK